MSHSTFDSELIKKFQEYYEKNVKPVQCTLKKLSGDMSIYSEVFDGYYTLPPEEGVSFTLHLNDSSKFFQTSTVQKLGITDNGWLIATRNSVYQLTKLPSTDLVN